MKEAAKLRNELDDIVSTHTIHTSSGKLKKLHQIQDKSILDLESRVKKGFGKSEGPFVKALDAALASFNVERQAYYSGTFVGNHVHQCLKVRV